MIFGKQQTWRKSIEVEENLFPYLTSDNILNQQILVLVIILVTNFCATVATTLQFKQNNLAYSNEKVLLKVIIVHKQEMRNSNTRGRSLLGLPDKDENKHGFAQSEMLLEKDNDKKLEELQRTVSKIKDVSVDIENGIQQSNRLIDSLVLQKKRLILTPRRIMRCPPHKDFLEVQ